MKVIYNKEIKEQFINEITENEGSTKVLTSLFNQIGKYEHEYKKDLYDFTSELRELYMSMPTRTFKSMTWKHSIIKNYCGWAIEKGYSKTNINPAVFISNKELENYVSNVAQKYQWIMSRDDLYEIAEMLYNPRDKATLALVFESFKGRANINDSFEELLNLKKEHVHEDELTIEKHRNNGRIKAVTVDSRTMKYVVEAIEETKYYDGNGQHPKGKFTPLIESDYVIRGIASKRNMNNAAPNRTLITNIFKIIKKYCDMPFLNAIKTFQSGMLVTCAEMEEEKGKPLETEDYVNIATKKFGQLISISYSLKQQYMRFKQLL